MITSSGPSGVNFRGAAASAGVSEATGTAGEAILEGDRVSG